MDIPTIKLEYNYYQFDGIFFFWLYLSFDDNYVPQYIRFLLPDERKIISVTEVIYLNAAKLEVRGVESIKNTRAAELLRTAYSAPNFKISNTGWHDKLISHVCQYYDHGQLFAKVPESPFDSSYSKDKTLKNDGIIKLLLLRKIEEYEISSIYEK